MLRVLRLAKSRGSAHCPTLLPEFTGLHRRSVLCFVIRGSHCSHLWKFPLSHFLPTTSEFTRLSSCLDALSRNQRCWSASQIQQHPAWAQHNFDDWKHVSGKNGHPMYRIPRHYISIPIPNSFVHPTFLATDCAFKDTKPSERTKATIIWLTGPKRSLRNSTPAILKILY